MKKLFTILLVCTFAFSTVTFVGCGGDDEAEATTTTDDGGTDDADDDADADE
jgi:hypothetical protein